MKYIAGLLVLFICCTACNEQEITTVPQNNPKPRTANFTEAQLLEADTARVPVSMVRNVRNARNGDLLVASYLGVYRHNGSAFTNLTHKAIPPRSSSFWDVLEDQKGNLWFGTKESGIYVYDGKSFRHFTKRDGLPSNMVLHLYEDRTGNIWLGTRFGASRYDGKSLRTFTTKDGLPNDDINTFMEDKSGRLWIGTRGDACYFDGEKFTVLRNEKGDAFYNVWGITEDQQGNIWFGGSIVKEKRGSQLILETGLWRYDGNAVTKVSDRSASAITTDKSGNIWTTGAVNPFGSGPWELVRYDAASLSGENPTATQVFSIENMLCGIVEARNGDIWFGAGRGVFRYDGVGVTDFRGGVSSN
ncbi:MAG: two-component regulator propeller domain-containing protein [Bacteroidia bacterium]